MMTFILCSFCKFLRTGNEARDVVPLRRRGFVLPAFILLICVFTVQSSWSQLEKDGIGVVNGYQVGPGADLRGADLRGADLRGANLEDADLRDANLEGADLGMATLIGCNLDGVNLSGARLYGVRISDSSVAPVISAAGRATYLKVIDLENISGGHESKIELLLDGGDNREIRLGNIEEVSGEHESKIGLLLDAGDNREIRLGNIEEVSGEHESKIGILLDSDVNREARLGALEEDRAAKDEQIRVLQNAVDAMSGKLDQLSVQVPALRAAIVERDEKIALLEERPTMEQLMDARATASLYRIDEADEGMVTLRLRIEHSEDLSRWTPVEDVITRTLSIPEGKRFYRFALVR